MSVICRTFAATTTKRKKIMSIDTYKLTSTEGEVLEVYEARLLNL